MRAAVALPAGPMRFTGARPGRDFFVPRGRPMLRVALAPGPDGLGLARRASAAQDPGLGWVVETAAVITAVVALGSAAGAWGASKSAKEKARHSDERVRQSAQIINEVFAPFVAPATSAEDLQAKLRTPVWSIHSGAEGDRRVPAYAVLWDIARAAGLLQHMPHFQKWATELGLASVPRVGQTVSPAVQAVAQALAQAEAERQAAVADIARRVAEAQRSVGE